MIWICSYTYTFESDVIFACTKGKAKKKALKILHKRIPDVTVMKYHETKVPVITYEELIEDIGKMSFKEWLYLIMRK